MEKFYEDKGATERFNANYKGKNMVEIIDIEQKLFDEKRPEIDEAHDKWLKNRSRMLTVQKLIDFLKTQDPNACILAFEPNSDAYIEQLPTLPSPDVLNVAMAKQQMTNDLKNWYKDTNDAEDRIKREIETVFRYSQDNDVIIRFN